MWRTDCELCNSEQVTVHACDGRSRPQVFAVVGHLGFVKWYNPPQHAVLRPVFRDTHDMSVVAGEPAIHRQFTRELATVSIPSS
jgi:hypothetical protein